MVNKIGRAHTLGKKNMKTHGVTNGPLNKTLLTSHSNEKFSGEIYVVDKEPLTAETYHSPKNCVIDTIYDFIQTQPVSGPHTTNMLDMNFACMGGGEGRKQCLGTRP